MKLFVFALAALAVTSAATISNEYLAPLETNALSQEYLPPVSEEIPTLADDGYRYKTVRKLRTRHRRDVNELPSNEYLPPTEQVQESQEVLSVAPAVQESAALADDGYRYKTVRRLKYRHRRDVNELPSNDYLPPTEQVQESQEVISVAPAAEESAVFADDGYRYKTVRRLKYRHRRDVNELPSNDYLPPTEQVQESQEVISVAPAAEESAVFADDGYRYKTVRRLKYRHRRDVNELPSNDYLPPTEQVQESQEVISVAPAAEESAVFADDGYRYKTVRRLKYRHRRDVNELPSNDYLPPTEQVQESQEVISVAPAAEESAVFADDGYRYKTVRRLKYRHRRDVNELPSNDYLPPTEQVQESQEVISVAPAAEESAVFADDGYRYKTVRRLKYRHRRDVNELPSNDYLPPTEQVQESQEVISVAPAAEESAVFADDGYRYKTVRRLKYRHRRDVNELPSNEYLPPTEQVQESQEVISVAPAVQESAVLADDGYRYKTVRRLKYRHRRDVNELPSNDYLPPTEQVQESQEVISVAPAVQESAVLADDGYRYKTVRRLKYRHRRDVNELPSSEYLPPTEQVQETQDLFAVAPATQEYTVLADDGYRYKTVRRLKHKRH